MLNMFKNYDNNNNFIPNNEYEFLPVESQYKDMMVLNAINNYSFRIPHKREDILDLSILYMQGTEYKVQKGYQDVNLIDIPDSDGTIRRCIATYQLNPEDTLNFNTYNREVKVQLKIILLDGRIEYSKIYLVKIINSLDANIEEEGE